MYTENNKGKSARALSCEIITAQICEDQGRSIGHQEYSQPQTLDKSNQLHVLTSHMLSTIFDLQHMSAGLLRPHN